jgi:6-pyruvoyltetrahydropterin/6-carboxytetrahydropterin synthase
MYKIEKRFTFPMGHRLSKHQGRCFSMHGHNFTVMVGLKSELLNTNDMVMDFSDLKQLVADYFDELDHCLLLNEIDSDIAKNAEKMGMRVKLVPHDPTAEKLAEDIYHHVELQLALREDLVIVKVDYVTVYENENSKATYSEK